MDDIAWSARPSSRPGAIGQRNVKPVRGLGKASQETGIDKRS